MHGLSAIAEGKLPLQHVIVDVRGVRMSVETLPPSMLYIVTT